MEKVQKTLLERTVKPDQSYQWLRNTVQLLSYEQSNVGRIASRYVGGVYEDRLYGKTEGRQPYTPVPKAKQKEAVRLIESYIFSPNALKIESKLAAHLQLQR